MILRGLIEPILDLYDQSRFEIRIAQHLGLAVTDLDSTPPEYIVAARIDLAVESIRNIQQKEAHEKQKRRTANPRRK